MRLRIIAGSTCAGLALMLSACGDSDPEASANDDEGRTVIIGTSNDAPLSFLDGDRLTGIDGDMMTAIAEHNGWEIEVQVTEFSTLIENLNTNRIDIIADAMTITEARQEQADFSDVWYYLNDAIVVHADDTTTTTYDDIAGQTLGTVTGTLYADYITELSGDDVRLFDSQATMLTALVNGEIAGAITDQPVAWYATQQQPDLAIRVVNPPDPYFVLHIGAAVRQGESDLLEGINDGLQAIKADGTYAEILARYEMPESSSAD